MMQEEERFTRRTRTGESLTRGEVTVTPQSRTLVIRGRHGGWVWNRPLAVLVERDGKEERIPIRDVTRIIQLALYGLSLVFAGVGLYTAVRQWRNHE